MVSFLYDNISNMSIVCKAIFVVYIFGLKPQMHTNEETSNILELLMIPSLGDHRTM